MKVKHIEFPSRINSASFWRVAAKRVKANASHLFSDNSFQFSIPNFQFPIFNSQFSIFNFQFPILLLLPLLLFSACTDDEEYADTPQGNFEALWHIIDEHYCFFDYKAENYGLDWNEVYQKYQPQFNENMSRAQQFEVMANMLSELRDGHVNLYAPFDVGRNWSWFENYASNYSDTLVTRYLGTDYRIASSMKYRILDDNIGYIRLESFSSSFGEGNLDEILLWFAPCRAIIIDIRGNGGGLLTSAEQLAARFTNEETLVGYIQHKTGPGHADFSSPEEQRLKPSSGIRWQKPVAVITNRQVFSAANEFVKFMKCCPHAFVIGDKTGGGAGLPFSSELPCGWSVRFSACPMYDKNMKSTEFGIAPHYAVMLSEEDFLRGRDTLIEYARQFLSQ